MKNPWLSLLGLALLIPVVAQVPLGSVSIRDAATRAAVLAVGLLIVDRLVIPVGRVVVEFVSPLDDGAGLSPDEEPSDAGTASS